MLPSFGCGLRRYLMEPNSLSTRTATAEDITAALRLWQRIQLVNVAVTPGGGPFLDEDFKTGVLSEEVDQHAAPNPPDVKPTVLVP